MKAADFAVSAKAVQQWVEDRLYLGYDPGDGLTSFLRPLTFGTRLGERLLLQAIWKAPCNIRPLVGIAPAPSTKGRGFMAWGYLLRHLAEGDPVFIEKAEACFDWLEANRCRHYPGYSWGNHFDFTTRNGTIPAGEPTIVWSGLIGQAYLQAYAQTGAPRYLDAAEAICDWILQVPREKTPTGDCLSYVAFTQSSIHNSNLLGAAMLAGTWRHRPRAEFLAAAQSAVAYSGHRQLPDGSWWYGEYPNYHWVDNFHTGYNLDSLKRYRDATGDASCTEIIARGYRYFKNTFFDPDGRPRYYSDRAYPIDIQCAAQAIDTLCLFSADDPEALPLACRTATWTIRHLQDHTGYFYFRQYPLLKAKTPYLHWGQATMFKALSHLCLCLHRTSARPTSATSDAASPAPTTPAALA